MTEEILALMDKRREYKHKHNNKHKQIHKKIIKLIQKVKESWMEITHTKTRICQQILVTDTNKLYVQKK